MKNNNTEIINLLHQINDTVQAAHPDTDDDVGAIVYNACLALAELLNVKF